MEVVNTGRQAYYMDGALRVNLNTARKEARKDWDFVFVIDGTERGGKSVLAGQCALYCDPSYSLDRCTFNPTQFIRACQEAEPFQAVVLDEGYGSLGSRGTMSKINRSIVKMLTEIGRKNLFIFIVLPSYFDLDKYVAVWRSRALIHVYHKQFRRGLFGFYGESRKKRLYLQGKKLYEYNMVKYDFHGRFTKHSVYDTSAYNQKKAESTIGDDEDDHDKVKKAVQNILVHDKNMFSQLDLAQIFDVHRNTIGNYAKELRY